jgi:hypothetical protein
VYQKGEALLRRQLSALAGWHLVNIIRKYELSPVDPAILDGRPPAQLVETIVSGVRAQSASGKGPSAPRAIRTRFVASGSGGYAPPHAHPQSNFRGNLIAVFSPVMTAEGQTGIAQRSRIATSGTSPTSIPLRTPGAPRRRRSSRKSRDSPRSRARWPSRRSGSPMRSTRSTVSGRNSSASACTPASFSTRTRASASTRACSRKCSRPARRSARRCRSSSPEILKIDKATIDKWLTQEARLRTYAHYLDDIQRRRAHTLTDAEERLMAASSLVGAQPSSIYSIFSNADFPYPSVTLADGKPVKLDASAFSLYRGVPNREDRKNVMSTFFTELGKYHGTFGATLNGQVQANEFVANARRYTSALESALDGANIPTPVYTSLVDGVNQGLTTFHRYLQLRKKMMNLPDLHYYDLYAPLVATADLTYTPEESEKNILAALAPLGPDYVAAIKKAFNERWIDLLPNDGKRSGRLFERRRLRRAPVHADQLQRQVRGHDDGGARARAHDAELPLEQDAAVPPRQLPDLRRRGRLDVQRGVAHRPHAQDDQGPRHAAVAAGELSRECEGHGVPADAVRRVRAEDPRDAGEGRADHRRGARQGVPGDRAQVLRPRQERLLSWTTTCSTSGRSSRTSITTSTSSSTRRRSRRRRRCRKSARGRPGRDEAISRVPLGGRLEVPDRAAEGRRRPT